MTIQIDLDKTDCNTPIVLGTYPSDQDEKWIVKRVIAEDTTQLIQKFEEIVFSSRWITPYPSTQRLLYRNQRKTQYLHEVSEKERVSSRLIDNSIENEKTIRWFYHLISAVYMHEHGITHRDINLLVYSWILKVNLVDFGISKYLGDENWTTITKDTIVVAE